MKAKIKIAAIVMIAMNFGVKAQNSFPSIGTVSIYETTDNQIIPKLSLGRRAGEALNFYVSDYVGIIKFKQDEPNHIHEMKFDIESPTINEMNYDFMFNKISKFRIKSNGNVGIGTTSPSAKLDVNGVVNAKTHLYINGVDNSNSIGAIDQLKISGYGIMGNRGSLYFTNGHSNGIIKFGIGGVHNTGEILTLRGIDKNANFKGSVAIGTATTGSHKLAVEGSIGAREVKVEANGWSDFVFEKEYKLPTLQEVENHIKTKGHLKDIPSANEVEKNGFFLGEMDSKLLQKIEELTLYTIEQEKSLKAQNSKINEQQKKIERLEMLVNKLLKDKK